MIDDDVKQEFEKVNARLDRIEQFLPAVATKADLERFATKDDLGATRRQLEAVIETLATKQDLERFATKQDLEPFPTRDEVRTLVRDEGERTRQHFNVVAESLRDEIRLGLEGNIAVISRVESLEHAHGRLESRVTALEAGRSRRKR